MPDMVATIMSSRNATTERTPNAELRPDTCVRGTARIKVKRFSTRYKDPQHMHLEFEHEMLVKLVLEEDELLRHLHTSCFASNPGLPERDRTSVMSKW